MVGMCVRESVCTRVCVCTYESEYARSTLHLCSSIRLSFFCVDIFRFMQYLLILFANFYKKCSLLQSYVCVRVFVCVCMRVHVSEHVFSTLHL